MTLLADVNHPGSQEGEARYWQPAHSLEEDPLRAEIIAAPYLLAPASGRPASLPPGMEGPMYHGTCSPLIFVQSFVL